MTPDELKTKRLAAGLSQQELAEAIGLEGNIARQRIYDYESGRRKMTPIVAKAIKVFFETRK